MSACTDGHGAYSKKNAEVDRKVIYKSKTK